VATSALPAAAPASTADADFARADALLAALRRLRAQLAGRVVGQDAVIEEILLAIVAGGHARLVGVPGLAKTLLVKSVAEACGSTSGASSSRPTWCRATSPGAR
jgi:MoxR-like ATPase